GPGRRFVLNCYLKATNGASLARLVATAIDNLLKDRAKATERGKLRRRLEGMLGNDRSFASSGSSGWSLAGHEDRTWQGDLAELERAAWAVRGVSITRWNTSGPTPGETKTALLTVVHAVLAAAAGSVRAEDLARVIQGRFGLLRPASFVSLDADDGWSEGGLLPASAEPHLDAQHARVSELWSELTPLERRLLPLLGEPPESWAAELENGVETASAIAERLTEKLRVVTVDDADHDQIIRGLVDRCYDADTRG
ncbi:MAG: hypothetical protein ACRDT2_07665, partial [Natronosporangium sp.]